MVARKSWVAGALVNGRSPGVTAGAGLPRKYIEYFDESLPAAAR